MKKKKDSERREPMKEKNLVLKAKNNDSSEEDSDMAYLTRRFQRMVRRNGGIPKRGNSSKPRNYDSIINGESQGISSSDSSMMAIECEAKEYDSIFALMAQSDNDEDDDNDKKLMSLANVLIDAYHSRVDDKDALTIELGDAEQTRDDLVVCVVDLKETIGNLENEKEVLTEKVASVEHERDYLMVVVVDLKETIENFSKEKNDLLEKVDSLEQERDDLLVVIIFLKETIEELKA
ncbi:autophagy-related protein 23-like [Nicotiana sylvestris]|uniref:autophagy-related protein 23-like n=1 Tax=Nicotiana sylvestris TaxID=4096 RepID=UPI00388C79C0